jgi:hypothetical protein
LVAFQAAASQVVSGVRVLSKIVPAVIGVRRAHPAYFHRSSLLRQPRSHRRLDSETPRAAEAPSGTSGRRPRRATTRSAPPTCPGSPCPRADASPTSQPNIESRVQLTGYCLPPLRKCEYCALIVTYRTQFCAIPTG